MDKRQINDDVFTMPDEATYRSIALGLNGDIHVEQLSDGQAVYIPGADRETYLSAYGGDSVETEDMLNRAISAIIRAVMVTKASGAIPLYIKRPVLNAEEIVEWARVNGFRSCLPPDDMHVTVIYSKEAFSRWLSDVARGDYPTVDDSNIVIRGGKRSLETFGEGAVVLRIESQELVAENLTFRAMGASSDYPDYKPHITVTYDGADVDVSEMFTGDIVLGPSVIKPINADWKDTVVEINLLEVENSAIIASKMDRNVKHIAADVLKIDDAQRIVWGWAYVSTEDGELLVDTQGDSIEPDEMEKMANDFMLGVRAGKVMHSGEQKSTVIHSFPMTKALADAFGIECKREGWIIAHKIHDDDVWNAYKTGKFTGFSIGGRVGEIEEY